MSEPILRLHELTKRFGSRPVVDRVSLDLEAGTVYSVVGPNGSGKTTLLNLISGLLRPDGGAIELAGRDITDEPEVRRAQAGLGRVFQSVRVFPRLSAIENLLVAWPDNPGERISRGLLRPRDVRRCERENRSRAEEYLQAVNIGQKAELWAEQLSFGEKKLVAIGRVLMANRQVLLLDEILSGVSERNRETLMKVIQEQASSGRLILLVEHDKSLLAELAAWEIDLANGKATLSSSRILGRGCGGLSV